MNVITRSLDESGAVVAKEVAISEYCKHCGLAIDPFLGVVHDETLGGDLHVDCLVDVVILSQFPDEVAR